MMYRKLPGVCVVDDRIDKWQVWEHPVDGKFYFNRQQQQHQREAPDVRLPDNVMMWEQRVEQGRVVMDAGEWRVYVDDETQVHILPCDCGLVVVADDDVDVVVDAAAVVVVVDAACC